MTANCITGFRLLCSVGLLFCPAWSAVFTILYLLAGISDAADGAVARKSHTVSDFGAKFDTAADFVFFAAVLWKLLPILRIPGWLWLWTGIIFLGKCATVAVGLARGKRLWVRHTVLNKITGVLLFTLPLTLRWIELRYSAVPICFFATVAAVQEGYLLNRDLSN